MEMKILKNNWKSLAVILGFSLVIGGTYVKEQHDKKKLNPSTTAIERTSNINKLFSSPLEGKCMEWNENGDYVKDGENPAFMTYEIEKDANGDGKRDYLLWKEYDCKSDSVRYISIAEDFDYDGEDDKTIFIRKVGYYGRSGPIVFIKYNNFNPDNPDEKGDYRKWIELWKTKEGFVAYEELGAIKKQIFYFDEKFEPASFKPNLKDKKISFNQNRKGYEEYFSYALNHAEELKYWFAGEKEIQHGEVFPDALDNTGELKSLFTGEKD